jgi:outer membrane autotransporter protein
MADIKLNSNNARVEVDGILNANIINMSINNIGTLAITGNNARINGNIGTSVDNGINLEVNANNVVYSSVFNVFNNTPYFNNITLGNEATFDIGAKTLLTKTFTVLANSTIILRVNGKNEYGKINATTFSNSGENTTLKIILNSSIFKIGDGERVELKIFENARGSALDDFKLFKNSRYEKRYIGSGVYEIEGKSAATAVANMGASANSQNVISAWIDCSNSEAIQNETAKKVESVLDELSQDPLKRDETLKALAALAPDVTPTVQSNVTNTFNAVATAVETRLSGGFSSYSTNGVSSGDYFTTSNIWVQGLYNFSKLSNSKDMSFNSNTLGVAFGIESKFSDESIIGIGYAGNNSDIKGYGRNTKVSGSTYILYGEYKKPYQFFLNGIMTFGLSKYDEIKNIGSDNLNVKVNANYGANTFAFQVGTGYEITTGSSAFSNNSITPMINFRYINVNTDGYTVTSGQIVQSNKISSISGLASVKFYKEFVVSEEFMFRSEFKIGVGYDFVNEIGNSIVKLPNNSSYMVEGKKLDPTSIEIGIGIGRSIDETLNLSINYDGKFRKNYQNSTILFNLKYNF